MRCFLIKADVYPPYPHGPPCPKPSSREETSNTTESLSFVLYVFFLNTHRFCATKLNSVIFFTYRAISALVNALRGALKRREKGKNVTDSRIVQRSDILRSWQGAPRLLLPRPRWTVFLFPLPCRIVCKCPPSL